MYKYNKYKYKYLLKKQLGSGTLNEYEDHKEEFLCGICYESFESAIDIIILSCDDNDYNLNHIYHHHCISDWVNRQKADNPSINYISCPECRRDIRTYTLYSSKSNKYNILDLAKYKSPVRKIISMEQERIINRLYNDNDFYERYMKLFLDLGRLNGFRHILDGFARTLSVIKDMIDNYALNEYINDDVLTVLNIINTMYINMPVFDRSDLIKYYMNYMKLLINIIKIIIEKYDILYVYYEYIPEPEDEDLEDEDLEDEDLEDEDLEDIEPLNHQIHNTITRLVRLLDHFTYYIIEKMNPYIINL